MNNSRFCTAFGLLALIAGHLGVVPAWGGTRADKPLAQAGGSSVSADEFGVFVREELSKGLKELGFQEKRAELMKLAVRKSLAAEAEKRGMGDDPQLKTALLQWKVQNYPEYYFAKKVDPRAKVTPEEIRALLNPQDSYQLSAMIFPAGEAGAREAREVHQLLAGGADFAATTRARSRGLAAAKGGDIGWQTVPGPSVTEEDAEILTRTAVGGFTEPIESEVGWVIFQVRDHVTVAQIIAQEGESTRQQLLGERVTLERQKKQEELRKKATITYPEGPGKPAAIVNGNPVYNASIAPDQPGSLKHNFSFANISTMKEKLAGFIDAFLVVLETERLGLDKDPALSWGLKITRINTLSEIYTRAQVPVRLAISDNELRAEYQRYYLPEIYRLQVVFNKERAKIEAALKAVQAKEDFGAVSERYSEGWLAKNKGVLAAASLADHSPEIQRVIGALPVDGVSPLLELGNGFALFKVLAKRTIPLPPYEEVSSEILSRLTLRRRTELVKEFMAREREKLDIRIDDEQLKRL